MLHLNFALDLEKLADDMINETKDVWKDPFEAPVVIFPDPKLEQWFRLRWIKKNGALVNLNATTIERFLFDILVGEGETCRPLTAEMLANVIIAYLSQGDQWKNLDEEVTRYLGGTAGKLDENHLFDFAQKTAALFLEYERSRPQGFAGKKEGFLDAWKKKEGTFFKGKLARESWQKKLYSVLFHGDSLLNKVFAVEEKRTGFPTKYDTIPYLYKENSAFNEEKLPRDEAGKPLPVFIFGLSGMGQFYRVILQDYAQNHEVHAYIQNPCMEFWEDARPSWSSSDAPARIKSWAADYEKNAENETEAEDVPEVWKEDENELLANWGRSGRDNIALWCQATNYDFKFKGDLRGEKGKTLLREVQDAIANRKPLESLDEAILQDGSLTVAAAPTKIREIEHLHSEICRLLRDGARIDDILVVSPCIDEYRAAIQTVFDQTPVGGSEQGSLHVRFAIVDSPARASLTEEALDNLFSISDAQGISRPEFFGLVRNPVVQSARGINEKEVGAWKQWVDDTHAYRKRGKDASARDDWNEVRRRLLLAQMTSDVVKAADGAEVLPHEDLACSDKASLCRFSKCIEDLEEWIAFSRNDIENLEALGDHLNRWIGMKKVPKSLKSEAIVRDRVSKALERLHLQQSAGKKGIPSKMAKLCLLGGAQGTEFSCGNLFVNGITFMKFAPNRTIPVKHLFFIGANSDSFPGTTTRNTLDLRKTCPPWPGDESPVAKNRYAFLCQFMSTSGEFHLSYVNKDLKKDAELYPSSVVTDLKKFIDAGGTEWNEKKIPLDETRPWSEIFTPKGLRNKKAFDGLTSGNPTKGIDDTPPPAGTPRPPERVQIHELAKFLKDPFQFQVGRLLRREDDADENVEKADFEPVFMNHLAASIILKRMLREGEEELKNDLVRTGKMPDGEFGKRQLEHICDKKSRIEEQAAAKGHDLKSLPFGEKISDLKIQAEEEGREWFLSGALEWWDEVNQALVEAVSSESKIKLDKSRDRFVAPYIQALALIASKKCETKQTIHIFIYSCDEKKGGPAAAEVSLVPKEARKKLDEIYRAAFIEGYGKCVPATFLEWPNPGQEATIGDYRDKILPDGFGSGEWKYFDKRALFDPMTDVGFEETQFPDQWDEARGKMKNLMSALRAVQESGEEK